KEKFNIQRERIDRFFPKNFTEKQKEDLIVQLLEGWYKKRQKEPEMMTEFISRVTAHVECVVCLNRKHSFLDLSNRAFLMLGICFRR
ncbi:MAG: hypothetical protein ACOYVD_08730, partial [Bacillota bacterium]